jgi:hypothetical protein
MSGELGIHILGRGFGESIVVQLPAGGIGVIDCFSPSLVAKDTDERRATNPVLRFLRSTLKAESLAFVGLTHPHEDHGRGFSQVLEDYRDCIQQIWMFQGFQSIYLERYLQALRRSSRRLPIERLLKEPPGTFSVEVARIRNLVLEQIDPGNPRRSKFRSFQGFNEFGLPGEPVRCAFLGPSDALGEDYEKQLADNLSHAFDSTGTRVNPDWRPDAVNHNLISPAVLIRFGKTQVLLGGDMENRAWGEVLAEQDDLNEIRPELKCQLIKIAHHGSITGFNASLAARLCGDAGKPIGVLTPFNRHRSPLPTYDGVSQILQHVCELIMTNLNESRRAATRPKEFGIEIDSADATPESRGIPVRWIADIRARPELIGAFSDEVLRTAKGLSAKVIPAVTAIPVSWFSDLATRPGLVDLLRPEVRDSTPPANSELIIEHDCRVSFYFDDEGNELRGKRYIGAAAGNWA